MTPYENSAIKEIIKWHKKPSFFSRSIALIGAPVEKLINSLPPWAKDAIKEATAEGIRKCINISRKTFHHSTIVTLDTPLEIIDKKAKKFSQSNSAGTFLSGFTTGLAGLPGAIADIPLTMTIFCRSIQMISSCYGINPDDPANKPFFLWLLTSGSPSPDDDSSETGYIMTRLGLGLLVREAEKFIASSAGKNMGNILSREAAPVLVRLINTIASRLGIQMTEKIAATAIPLAGGFCAALINSAFMKDINSNAIMAGRMKFLIRKYGEEEVINHTKKLI